jgi:hypothetical protein
MQPNVFNVYERKCGGVLNMTIDFWLGMLLCTLFLSRYAMKPDDTLLIPVDADYTFAPADASSRALTCKMDPEGKNRIKY